MPQRLHPGCSSESGGGLLQGLPEVGAQPAGGNECLGDLLERTGGDLAALQNRAQCRVAGQQRAIQGESAPGLGEAGEHRLESARQRHGNQVLLQSRLQHRTGHLGCGGRDTRCHQLGELIDQRPLVGLCQQIVGQVTGHALGEEREAHDGAQ